jgi:hypothetical protein
MAFSPFVPVNLFGVATHILVAAGERAALVQ